MPATSPSPLRIVLVEDSDAYANLAGMLLAMEGGAPSVTRFRRLDEALRHLAHDEADCVLLDLTLPDASGPAVLERVLAVAPSVPVVVLTGHDDDALSVKLIRAGAQDFIVKGQEGGGALPRAVRHAVERRRTDEREEVARLVRDVAADVTALGAARAERRAAGLVTAAALAGLLLVFAVQMLAGTRFGGVNLFYVLPVAWVALRLGLRPGLGLSVLAVAANTVWAAVHLPGQLGAPSILVRAAAFAAVAVLAHRSGARTRDSARLLQAIVDGTSDTVYVRDLAGRYVMVNRALEDLLGRPAKAIVGRTPAEVAGEAAAEVWQSWDDAVLAAGEPRRYWRTSVVNGAERTFSTVKAPVRDARGRIAGIVGISRDETDVRRLEAESSRYFDLAPDMLCTLDPSGRLERLNEAWTATLGWTHEELRSRALLDFVHPEDRGHASLELEQLFAGLRDGCVNRLATRWNGWRDIEWTARVVPAEGLVFAAARDVTERNAMAKALAAGEERYRTLVHNLPGSAVVSFDHDLRFTFAAGPALAASGLDGPSIVGRTLAEVLPRPMAGMLTPRYRAALAGHAQAFELETPGGRTFWVQLTPVEDGGGITGGMVLSQDISAARQTERELDRAEERFRTAFDQAPIGMAVVGLDGRFERANTALSAMSGRAEAELIGLPATALLHPEDAAELAPALERMLAGSLPVYEGEHRGIALGGEPLWVSIRAAVVRDREGAPDHVLAQVHDVTERRRAEALLRHEAEHDALTGLLNRRRFDQELERHVALAARHGAEGAVLLLDVDGFKAINDSQGHAAGDARLARVAGVLRENLRGTDLLARLGGDEFAVLLPRGSAEDADVVAAKLVAAIREDDGAGATVSVGVAAFDGVTPGPELLASADRGLYAAKRAGRDGWCRLAVPAAAR